PFATLARIPRHTAGRASAARSSTRSRTRCGWKENWEPTKPAVPSLLSPISPPPHLQPNMPKQSRKWKPGGTSNAQPTPVPDSDAVYIAKRPSNHPLVADSTTRRITTSQQQSAIAKVINATGPKPGATARERSAWADRFKPELNYNAKGLQTSSPFNLKFPRQSLSPRYTYILEIPAEFEETAKYLDTKPLLDPRRRKGERPTPVQMCYSQLAVVIPEDLNFVLYGADVKRIFCIGDAELLWLAVHVELGQSAYFPFFFMHMIFSQILLRKTTLASWSKLVGL
ncbi:hypothetical protein BKA70DRAFT_1464184, partial [Coprinopsis sp. MPI-PUGE-AT-0042]